jgi:hypothetical protein
MARLSFSLTWCEETKGSTVRTSMPRALIWALICSTTGTATVAPFGRLVGEDAGLVPAGVDEEAAGDVLRRDLEPFRGRGEAALRLLGRVLEVVEPDRQRTVMDGPVIERPVRRHGQGLADLHRRLPDAAGGDVDADELPEQVLAVEPFARRDLGFRPPFEERGRDRTRASPAPGKSMISAL